jgi:putative Ca2+/H+ antiporter (TMEM165/GDT1 family)
VTFEPFLVSTGVVALGEMGDKTQLLALLLAARYRKPWTIVAGILVATVANHAGAAALGTWLTRVLDPAWMRWGLGLSFLAVAVWMLIPDKADDDTEGQGTGRLGVFGITVVAFFLAEMGDKTQIATVMLGARYNDLLWVTAGTTLGMMLANVPAVFLGDRVVRRVPIAWVHRIAALVFASLGVAVLMGVGGIGTTGP